MPDRNSPLSTSRRVSRNTSPARGRPVLLKTFIRHQAALFVSGDLVAALEADDDGRSEWLQVYTVDQPDGCVGDGPSRARRDRLEPLGDYKAKFCRTVGQKRFQLYRSMR